jgi:hypothetical protein
MLHSFLHFDQRREVYALCNPPIFVQVVCPMKQVNHGREDDLQARPSTECVHKSEQVGHGNYQEGISRLVKEPDRAYRAYFIFDSVNSPKIPINRVQYTVSEALYPLKRLDANYSETLNRFTERRSGTMCFSAQDQHNPLKCSSITLAFLKFI